MRKLTSHQYEDKILFQFLIFLSPNEQRRELAAIAYVRKTILIIKLFTDYFSY